MNGNRGEQDNFGWKSNALGTATTMAMADDDEDSDLDEDHKLLLQSSQPLLKSRNSAVVLAACSLHYHCGVASIKVSCVLLMLSNKSNEFLACFLTSSAVNR